jgi:hypothetical protein
MSIPLDLANRLVRRRVRHQLLLRSAAMRARLMEQFDIRSAVPALVAPAGRSREPTVLPTVLGHGKSRDPRDGWDHSGDRDRRDSRDQRDT